ncbi:hypothetical protein KPSA3_07715 [Pseudomonas syringae pv. actinidiae]|uniref:Uncharacterized protein n=1 Tax=Pseudomonas syringae pv. actinidiae TaxID=103796 RepID=A0AAN4TPY3_PSESF|nr:hypothetical protein KPSA3_07715 [Pseudomonas syringae pv. actinidiae]
MKRASHCYLDGESRLPYTTFTISNHKNCHDSVLLCFRCPKDILLVLFVNPFNVVRAPL